jgi:hypothetical protein
MHTAAEKKPPCTLRGGFIVSGYRSLRAYRGAQALIPRPSERER